MEEIKVGDFIRTKNGIIEKIKIDAKVHTYYRDEILKHSSNIIDLIEVRRLCEWRNCFKNF